MPTGSAQPLADEAMTQARLIIERRLRGAAAGPGVTPPLDDEGEAPLAPAQLGLWVVDQMLPGNTLYGAYESVRLRGPLDPDAMHAAFTALADRHAVLRTIIVAREAGNPVQLVNQRGPAAFRVVDLTNEPLAARTRLAVMELDDEVATGFDLAAGPLMRILLVRVEPEDHILLVNLHHVIADEWSLLILVDEVGELYRSYLEGRSADLEPLPIQYRDYAQLKRSIPADRLANQLAWWTDALAGVSGGLRLPTDRPRPRWPSHRGAAARRTLPAGLSTHLRDLASAHATTPFTVLMAVLATVLAEDSGQSSFAIGSLAAGRDVAEAESLIGMFAMTIAIPFRFGSDPTFADLIAATRRHVLGALDHQDITFERIVAKLNVERDSSRNPLFQVMFKVLEDVDDRWRFPGVTTEPIEPEVRQTKFDLSVTAQDVDRAITVEVQYATDLFDQTTIDGLLGRFESVARRAAAGPATRCLTRTRSTLPSAPATED